MVGKHLSHVGSEALTFQSLMSWLKEFADQNKAFKFDGGTFDVPNRKASS